MERHPIRILLVAEDGDERRRLTQLLRDQEPERFVIAAAPLSFAPALAGDGFDIVLVDLGRTGDRAMEAVQTCRRAHPGLPLVVLADRDREPFAARALDEGAQDYLVREELTGRLMARTLRHALERFHTLRALLESEQRYALAVEGANDVLWDWDLRGDELYLAPKWRQLVGCSAEEATTGKPTDWLDRVHLEDLPGLLAHLDEHLKGSPEFFENEHRLRHRDGRHVWVRVRGTAVRDERGNAYRIAGSFTDITERKRTEERLRHDALHDELTGLPNRSFFTNLLERSIGRARRRPHSAFAVLFLDLDRFKVVNDSLGHTTGDRWLRLIAERLQLCLRPEDSVARLGGDEFTVLLEGIEDASDAVRVAERIQQDLSRPFEVGGHEMVTSVSIGIALSSTGYATPEEILRDADIAMYRAKAQGKARYELFDRDMHVQAVSLLKLETQLRRALERHELRLHYQPIVDFGSGKLTGFEALIRWQHPQHGLLLPSVFVPLAEETGLVVPLGRWVLEEACRQMAEWRKRFPDRPELGVSVNLSGRQLAEPDLAGEVESVIRDTGVEPGALRLEITESVIMENAERTQGTLNRLRDLDVKLQIDDFGTGYSSLSYLHRFPLDALKIDRSFVGGLTEESDNLKIVRSIVGLGHSLGMHVTAEGVETRGQLDILRRLECNQGQGFLFYRPMEAEVAEAVIGTDLSF